MLRKFGFIVLIMGLCHAAGNLGQLLGDQNPIHAIGFAEWMVLAIMALLCLHNDERYWEAPIERGVLVTSQNERYRGLRIGDMLLYQMPSSDAQTVGWWDWYRVTEVRRPTMFAGRHGTAIIHIPSGVVQMVSYSDYNAVLGRFQRLCEAFQKQLEESETTQTQGVK